MEKPESIIVYFREPGPKNTSSVIQVLAQRMKKTGPKTVVVASTSGATGKEFAESLTGRARVVAISHREMEPQLKARIRELGGTAMDRTNTPLSTADMNDVKNTLKILGQGFKVAVEVAVIATEMKLIKPYVDILAVGGSGKGADTAIVVRSTTTNEMFSEDPSKKLEVREIVAIPTQKKWW